MVRTVAQIYLLVGIGLSIWLGLHLIGTVGPPDPLVPRMLNAMAVPGSLLSHFVGEDQPWMHLLIWLGSILVNFGLLSWLADNVEA